MKTNASTPVTITFNPADFFHLYNLSCAAGPMPSGLHVELQDPKALHFSVPVKVPDHGWLYYFDAFLNARIGKAILDACGIESKFWVDEGEQGAYVLWTELNDDEVNDKLYGKVTSDGKPT